MAEPKKVIGLDLGSHAVKYACVDLQTGTLIESGRWVIPNFAEQAVEEETTQVREAPTQDDSPEPISAKEISSDWTYVIENLLGIEDFEKALVVTNAPDEVVAAVRMDVPFSDREKVTSVIPHLLVDELPMDPKKAVFDFYSFDNVGGDGASATVAFAKRTEIEAFIDNLKTWGIDPAVVSAPALTWGAFCTNQFKDDTVAVVDMGHAFSNIVVLDQGRPILARNNRTAGLKLTKMLAERFNVPFEEAEEIKHQYAAVIEGEAPNEQMKVMSATIVDALKPIVRDIRRSLQGLYAKTGREVNAIYICGGTAQIKNLERYLSAELSIPVRRLPTPEADTETAMAYALGAVYSNDRLRNRLVNLRQGDLSFRGLGSPLKRLAVRFALVAAAILAVVLGTFYLQKIAHETRRDAMKKELSIQSKKVFGEQTMSSKSVRAKFAGDADDAEQFVPKMSAYELLHDVTSRISKDIDLELKRVEVDVTRNVIQVVGTTSDAQAVDRVVSDLREIECFKKVTPGKTKVKNDKAEFDVQISSGCS